MKNISMMILLIVCSTFSHLASVNASEENDSCFPKSLKRYPKNLKSASGLNEFEFNQLIDRVTKNMSPWVYKYNKKKIIVEKKWNDEEVNAHATRDDDDHLVLMFTGGLARHPLMTKDAFMLLVCHEVGHYLGGTPKQWRGETKLKSWSSAEGQADYFATSKCLPQVFSDRTETKLFDQSLNLELRKNIFTKCDNEICARVVLAGFQLANVFADLKPGVDRPNLLVNDPTIVEKTFMKHPKPQCRLDTYISGAKCDSPLDEMFDDEDPKVGACLYAKKKC